MLNSNCAPILIPTLSRYDHFYRCVESLKKNFLAVNSELYIALDFPISEKHLIGYNQINQYIKNLSGFKRVVVIKRDENYGATRNLFESIEYLLQNYNCLIFTEDDNEFSPNFLDYINQGLQLYENNPHILAVSGYNYPIKMPSEYLFNHYFVKEFPAWGTGIWKDKFMKLQNIDIEYVNRVMLSPKNSFKLLKNKPGSINSLLEMIKKDAFHGDVVFGSYLILNNCYTALPTVSKVRNYGHDGSGVNCGTIKNNLYSTQPIDSANDFKIDLNTPVTTYDIINNKLMMYLKNTSCIKIIIKYLLFKLKCRYCN